MKGVSAMGKKKILDIVMAVLMIGVMSYQATGSLLHEVCGVLLLLLFVLHNILNRTWYRNLGKGRYSTFRGMMLTVNVLTFIAMEPYW